MPWRLAVEDYAYTEYVAYCCMFIMIFIDHFLTYIRNICGSATLIRLRISLQIYMYMYMCGGVFQDGLWWMKFKHHNVHGCTFGYLYKGQFYACVCVCMCVGSRCDDTTSFLLLLPPSLPPSPSQEDSLSPSQKELSSLQSSMADTQPVGPLLSSCLSLDQVSILEPNLV